MNLATEEMTWLHFHAKTTIKLPNGTQNIVRPTPIVPSFTEWYKFYVYVTNNVEGMDSTPLRIHSGKNAAVDENLNKSGKELS